MNIKSGLAVFALVAVILVCIALIVLSTPHSWPIVGGTLKAQSVVVGNDPFLMVIGEPMNKLGQIQSINIDVDENNRQFVVSRCMVRWSPFYRDTVNNQWPIFYPLTNLKPGRYEVNYDSYDGKMLAGIIEVPLTKRVGAN